MGCFILEKRNVLGSNMAWEFMTEVHPKINIGYIFRVI